MTPKLFIAVKAFVVNNDKILVLRESEQYEEGVHAGKFDVIGGRLEPGEDLCESALREIKEETDLNIEVKQYIGNINHQYSHFKINVKLYKCQYISGEAKPLSSQQVKWINKKNINKFTFPTATHKLFKLL